LYGTPSRSYRITQGSTFRLDQSGGKGASCTPRFFAHSFASVSAPWAAPCISSSIGLAAWARSSTAYSNALLLYFRPPQTRTRCLMAVNPVSAAEPAYSLFLLTSCMCLFGGGRCGTGESTDAISHRLMRREGLRKISVSYFRARLNCFIPSCVCVGHFIFLPSSFVSTETIPPRPAHLL